MRHVDPDTLALIALGEPAGDADERAHLAECAQCADDVASLAATVTVARSVTADDAVVPAPPQVWQAVRAELGLSEALEPDGLAPAPARDRDSRRRRWSTPWIAAAAAAGVVIGGVGGTIVARTLAEPATTVVAQATLDPLPGWDAAGDAVVEERDGVFELVVNFEGGDDVGGYREVWLIDSEVTRLVSLGVLVGSTGRFTLPPGVDLTEFPVVDISDEPFDGDPAHSGDSILRGLLDA